MSKQKRMNQAVGKSLGKPIPTAPFQEYDETVFAAMAEAEVQDSTLPIMQIIPDRAQPRRIVPHEIRRDWDGTPQGYGAIIDAWEIRAHKDVKWSHPVDILIGKDPVLDLKTDDPLVLNFAELLGFAANIRDIGLNHPIGVVKRGDYHRIVFGERRWTAFQILNHYLGNEEDWSNISARIIVATDWELAKAQSAENNQSKRLNAIARAREFANLLMIARTDGGERYDSWNQLVNPGGCDRAWYAQVANGELHRIPRNLGPQFEQALNITTDMMRKYRALLRLTEDHKIDDALWMMGDAGNWSENFLREVAQYLNTSEIDEILNLSNGYTVTTVTVYATESALHKAVKAKKEAEEEAKKAAELTAEIAKKQAGEEAALAAVQAGVEQGINTPDVPAADSDSHSPTDQSTWASTAWVGKLAWAASLPVTVARAVTSDTVIVVAPNGEEIDVNIRSLRERTESTTTTQLDSKPQPKDLTSKAAQTVAGRIGIVQWDANGYVELKFPDGTTAQMEKQFVSHVPMTEWYEAVRRYNESKASKSTAGTATVGTTTPATTTTPTAPAGIPGSSLTVEQIVGKPVVWNGKDAFAASTDSSSSEAILIKIGRDERIVHKNDVMLKPGVSAEPLDANDEGDDDLLEEDDFSPDQPEQLDYEPFDAINIEMLNAVCEVADILDIQEAEIIADLRDLDRTRLQRVLINTGMAEVHKWTEIYQQAMDALLDAIRSRTVTHLKRITELAEKLTENE